MKDINVFTATGRLTRDSELKYANSGTAICNFSLAFSRSIKKGDQWEDKSCFIDCVIFGKRGEALNKYLNKGQQVTITGEIDFQRWEKDGQKHSKHSVLIQDIRLMGSKNGSAGGPSETVADQYDDDIPF